MSNYTEIFAQEEKFLEEITLPADTPRRYLFQMSIPPDASPSFDSEDKIVRWQVLVKLMGRTFEKEWLAEAELRVKLP